MIDRYTLVREGMDQWINSPNNGGECCQTTAETVNELNQLLDRIKRLEEAIDTAISFCEFHGPVGATPDTAYLIAKNLRKAKEVKS